MFEYAQNLQVHGGTFIVLGDDGYTSVTKVADGKVSTTLDKREQWTTRASAEPYTPASPDLYDSYDPCNGPHQQAPPWTSRPNAFSAQAPTNGRRYSGTYGDGPGGRRDGVDKKTMKSKNPFQRYSDVDSSRPRSPPPTFEEAFGDDESPVDQQGASSKIAPEKNNRDSGTKSRFTFEDAYGLFSNNEVPLGPSVRTDRWENMGTNFPPDPGAGWEGPSRTVTSTVNIVSNGRVLYSGSVPPGTEFDPLTVQGGDWTSEERLQFSQIMHNGRELTQWANEVSERAMEASERAMEVTKMAMEVGERAMATTRHCY